MDPHPISDQHSAELVLVISTHVFALQMQDTLVSTKGAVGMAVLRCPIRCLDASWTGVEGS